jgi:hypothetical protein
VETAGELFEVAMGISWALGGRLGSDWEDLCMAYGGVAGVFGRLENSQIPTSF